HGPIVLTLDVVGGLGTYFRVHHGLGFGYTFGIVRVSGDTLLLASSTEALERRRVPECDSVATYPEVAMMGCVSPVEEHFFPSIDTFLVRDGQLVLLGG